MPSRDGDADTATVGTTSVLPEPLLFRVLVSLRHELALSY